MNAFADFILVENGICRPTILITCTDYVREFLNLKENKKLIKLGER